MDFEKLKLGCECGGKMKPTKTTWKGIDVKGWTCGKCGEEVINPADAQRALEIEKARKRNELKVKIRRVGKSSVVTVPHKIMELVHLKNGQKLEWSIENDKLVLTP